MSVLMAKLDRAQEEREAREHAAARKEQIGNADRSEKIRTYNTLQDRLTDHRIKESWHNLPNIMEGNIDEIVDALQNFKGEVGPSEEEIETAGDEYIQNQIDQKRGK